MKMKSLSICLATIMMVSAALTGCGGASEPSPSAGSGNADKVYNIKISYENQPGEPVDVGANEWKKLAEEKSGGRLKIELYPSSQLGAKKDVIEQGMAGGNVIQIGDASFLQDYVADIGIISGPYLVDNFDQLFKITKSDWFKEQEKLLQDKGIHIVSTNWIYGDRHLLAKKAVKGPEDMKGLKIRVPNNQLAIKTFEAMGSVPTPMPFSEVYPAAQQGVIDGLENPAPVIFGSKTHEVLKDLTLTGHMKMITQWIAGQKFMETLPPDLLQILKETADQAGEVVNGMIADADKKAYDDFEAAGVTIHEIDTTAFKQAAKAAYDQFPEWTPGLYDKLQQIAAQ